MTEVSEGGWRVEGKDRPVTPIICVSCQTTGTTSPRNALCATCLSELKEHGRVLGGGHMPGREKP